MSRVPLCFPCQDTCPLLPAGALGGVQAEAGDVFSQGVPCFIPRCVRAEHILPRFKQNIPEKVEIFTELKLTVQEVPWSKSRAARHHHTEALPAARQAPRRTRQTPPDSIQAEMFA